MPVSHWIKMNPMLKPNKIEISTIKNNKNLALALNGEQDKDFHSGAFLKLTWIQVPELRMNILMLGS